MATAKTVTPRGTLEWVTISGEGKENLSGKLQYVANLVLDPKIKEHAAYLDSIEEYWKANKPPSFKKAAKSMGIYDHKERTDETDEEGRPVYAESGLKYLAFKTGTSYPDGSQKTIKVYNAKGKEVAFDGSIGNGSVGCISGAMGIYANKSKTGAVLDAGVTLYLDAIQIIKLVEYSDDAGFGSQDDEDGWGGETDFEAQAASDEPAQPRL